VIPPPLQRRPSLNFVGRRLQLIQPSSNSFFNSAPLRLASEAIFVGRPTFKLGGLPSPPTFCPCPGVRQLFHPSITAEYFVRRPPAASWKASLRFFACIGTMNPKETPLPARASRGEGEHWSRTALQTISSLSSPGGERRGEEAFFHHRSAGSWREWTTSSMIA
jgi:hypothetical protein